MTGSKEIWTVLRLLKQHGAITLNQYKVYKGQILSGDEEGCIRGLKRKGLIKYED